MVGDQTRLQMIQVDNRALIATRRNLKLDPEPPTPKKGSEHLTARFYGARGDTKLLSGLSKLLSRGYQGRTDRS
jgi:flagellar biogenesis protein FliO